MAKSEPRAASVKTQSTVSSAVRKTVALVLTAALVYGLVFLFIDQRAQAAEPAADVPIEGVVTPVEEPAPETGSNRFSQAFDLIFKGDSREIVAEANAELEARMQAADEREAAIAKREVELAEAENATAAAKYDATVQAERTAKAHKALTDCVLTAINPVEEAQ